MVLVIRFDSKLCQNGLSETITGNFATKNEGLSVNQKGISVICQFLKNQKVLCTVFKLFFIKVFSYFYVKKKLILHSFHPPNLISCVPDDILVKQFFVSPENFDFC